ncbi:unnamed protein product [Aureobasidium pullulans]|nr:unnamed protein product [Aureobasidium pullulans]
MSTPLPPDPYVALGLAKDATAAQIKTTYRKLVLKCHPDKVTDESKKAEASDQFHRIQQAYEILSDEGRKSRYDAHVKLAEQRKQSMNSRPPVEVRTAAYEMPTSGPGRATFTARGPERVYEERRPERSDSDDYFGSGTRTASRKHDDYERQAKKAAAPPPRDDRDRARVVERERRESERLSRTDKRRTRDQDTKRDRDRKYSTYDEDNDADLRHEAERRRKAAEEAARDKELRERERAKVERERERERGFREERGRDKDDYERERERPSRRGYDDSAQYYSRLEDDSDERRPATRPTTLYTSTSSPSSIKLPRGVERGPPIRSASMKVDERDVPPMPVPIRRSETMPNISPKRAKDSKPSNLRETEFSGGYPTPSASPDYAPSPTTHKTYHYPRREPSTSREDLDYRRPLERDYDRERDRRIHHSPEPIRPSKSSATPRYAAAPQPPPIRTNPSYNSSSYTTESPTSYTNPRPSPTRRETHRDYEAGPKVSTPKANSSARYEGSPIDIDSGYKKAPLPEDPRLSGYSSHRASASAQRPRMHRERTSEYAYPRTQAV